MAKYTGSVCKLCRREGFKLFLKGDRCLADKCAFNRRPYAPGQHGQRRQKPTDYALQLRSKQKAKRIYGVLEKQFRNYFIKADRMTGITGANLLLLLERRLDNVVYRMGFSHTRSEARQMIRHNHVQVNGKKVNIPSYLVKVGDEVTIKDKSRKIDQIVDAMEASVSRITTVPWIEVNHKEFMAAVKAFPARKEIDTDVNEQLIVELYSK